MFPRRKCASIFPPPVFRGRVGRGFQSRILAMREQPALNCSEGNSAKNLLSPISPIEHHTHTMISKKRRGSPSHAFQTGFGAKGGRGSRRAAFVERASARQEPRPPGCTVG